MIMSEVDAVFVKDCAATLITKKGYVHIVERNLVKDRVERIGFKEEKPVLIHTFLNFNFFNTFK
jgi:hypothetical protein